MVFNFFPDCIELDFIIRILLACVCGFSVGYERTKHNKSAGMRTHMIVAVGACIFTLVSKYGFLDALGESMRVDVSRVSCNIVTGVGFLGAGTIFLKDDQIRGLTTAAGIWCMAAIGMAFGSGVIVIGIIATLVVLVIQRMYFGNSFTSLNFEIKQPRRLIVCMDDEAEHLEKLMQLFEKWHIVVDSTYIKRHKNNSEIMDYSFNVRIPDKTDIPKLVTDLSMVDSVRSVDC